MTVGSTGDEGLARGGWKEAMVEKHAWRWAHQRGEVEVEVEVEEGKQVNSKKRDLWGRSELSLKREAAAWVLAVTVLDSSMLV